MTILRTLLVSLLIPFALHAQLLQHPLTAHPGDAAKAPRERVLGTMHINILAVMVQFQTDTDQRTTGNGQFDTSHVAPGDIPVDAPPRNASYFSDHLTFLANYYKKASKGKVLVTSTLIPQVITLPNVMSTYSPLKNGPTTPVTLLARDTWRVVDSLTLVPAFTDYHAFVIFHAGVGHDIDLVSALGYDPADRDIPSLYLAESAFQEALGTPGVPVHGGSYVYNTLVLPETESRKIPGIGGDVFLEYGINGLLCASLGNFLGLPDLFDTKNGATAIGRFGLMDGQGIFSFNGVFPPEPSAWEKYWLGWIDPITVGNGSATLQLPAVALADTVYRVSIGPSEYFLVENRNRDPQRNGQTVTMRYDNAVTTQSFRRDTTGFNAFDVSALKGNVIDVEDLDWSLPGGVDDTTFYDGGVLVWHIDERVIAANVATNSVNADPKHRGVDLEEADGSQDIGQSYGTFSAGSGSEIGTPLDFWYAGSNSPVNKNEFSATTFPSTQSYDGGDSHVAMRNFSARGPRMTVQVTVGDSAISMLPGFPKQTFQRLAYGPNATDDVFSLAVAKLMPDSPPAIVVTTRKDSLPALHVNQAYPALVDAKVYAWLPNGQRAMPGGFRDGLIAREDAQVPSTAGFATGPLITDVNGDGIMEVTVGSLNNHDSGSTAFRAVTPSDGNADSLADVLSKFNIQDLTGSGAVSGSILMFGGVNKIHLLGIDGSPIVDRNIGASPSENILVSVGSYPSPYLGIATGSNGAVVLYPDPRLASPFPPEKSVHLAHTVAGPAAVARFTIPGVSGLQAAVSSYDGFLFLLDSTLSVCPGFPVKAGDRISAPPALGDINGDGLRDIVVFSGNRICAFNSSGVFLDGFPITLATSDDLASAPILGDVDGNGSVDIVGVTTGGLVVAYDGHGTLVRGFPLVAGGLGNQSAAMFTSSDSVYLAVASASGSVSAWLTGRTSGPAQATRYPWPQFQHDAHHSGIDLSTISGGVPLSNESFPKSRAYNWPNPVYDRTTQIRYYLKDDARVHIKIFDLAGDLVTEFDGPGVGGRDNETVWDVSGVQTGIYYAHIDASGPAASGAVVIKIAVVH